MHTKSFKSILVLIVRATVILVAAFSALGFSPVLLIGKPLDVSAQAANGTAINWVDPMPGWQQINTAGFGDSLTTGVTALEAFHGQLYAGASNWDSGGQIWRLGEAGEWQPVNQPGFGSGPANPAIIDLAVFQGQLYAGVGWGSAGQIWRSGNGTTWRPVMTDGFGDPSNTTAVTSLASFRGMLYAGTGSASVSAQIWRSSTGASGTWVQVAPDDSYFPGNVADFTIYNGVLFAAIESSTGGPAQVWRSINGSDWTTVISDGFGDPNSISTGGFAQFEDRLYLGVRNDWTGGQIWRTLDGINWERTVSDGFGDPNNLKVESLLAFDDFLYAATYNEAGMQIWRSVDGVNWTQVVANGIGDSNNYSTLWNSATIDFQDKYLIGTWNTASGGQLWMFTP